MSDTSNSDIQGKKIFFLHPSAVVINMVIEELAQQEYEVYIAKDQRKIKRVLQKFPDSIVFVDINEGGMTEVEWETWIRTVTGALPTISVGIVSSNKDEKLIQKYTNVLKVKCGYTVLKSDMNQNILQIFEHLKNVDAKGRRKYIRATIASDTASNVNLPHGNGFVNGVIKDISVVGISCVFDQDPNFQKNALLKDVQIKLQTMIIKVEAVVFGSRPDGKTTAYVLLFTQRIDPNVKAKIRKYISQSLQNKMDPFLK